MPEEQVADERFGRDGVGFRQGVPVDDEQPLVRNQLFDAVAVFGTDGEIIFQYNGAAVHAEVFVLRFGLQKMNDIVHQICEPELALLGI